MRTVLPTKPVQALLPSIRFVPQIAPLKLLGGNGEECGGAVQAGGYLRVGEGHGGPQHTDNLSIVAARVGKALVGSHRVGGTGQAVQFTDESHVGTGLLANAGPQAGDGQPLPGLQPQLFQGVRHDLGSAVLVVSLLGVGEQILSQSLQLVGTAVQNGENFLFDCVHVKQLLIFRFIKLPLRPFRREDNCGPILRQPGNFSVSVSITEILVFEKSAGPS